MRETTFQFQVIDAEGLWGELRQTAKTMVEAEALVREYLLREEVEPNGSLASDFTINESEDSDK